ncbi:Protein CURVATURE THYLAKOID 1A, chloroplastic [Gracilariopsis chorda]|uniref:Protein CURVATURE THYLAKOID 1A, chloroplastic n=1 Tax=Gracilariopsis chorda TaxID=448386 RepID=A0A2V3J2F5_9FLOR|nr:Protein CURVATURE THYLAKOID 1A, chloroplastic [Gracilariopsis chorda]|eukprot:PXF48588.1 Protein CURVATURE THYLAKOID 1A, chloroplastic [Gracilariopsis chorda]
MTSSAFVVAITFRLRSPLTRRGDLRVHRQYGLAQSNVVRRPCIVGMSEEQPPNKGQSELSLEYYTKELSGVGEKASATAQALLDDLAARPEYYLNVFGVLFGLVLSAIVLSATMFALEALPIIPDVLRIIGLVYLFWFLKKYLFSGNERKRLGNDIDEFVAGVRGPVVNNIRTEQLTDTET